MSVATGEGGPSLAASRARAVAEALAVGAVLYGLSWLWAEHDLRIGFGDIFRKMSGAPFHSGSPFEFRFLVPLLGWVTGLSGDRYFLLSDLGGAAFLSLVYLWARRFHRSRGVAALLAGSLAFLSPLQFNHVAPGRSDIFAYVLLVAAMSAPRWTALFVFLGLSTHEFFAIYVPWLYLFLWRFERDRFLGSGATRRRRALELAGAVVAYLAIRLAIAALNDFSVTYTAGYYWSLVRGDLLAEWRRQPVLLGSVVSLKLFWLAGAWAVARRVGRGGREVWMDVMLLVAPAAAAFATLLIAHDTSRFLGHAFPFVLLLPVFLPAPKRILGAVLALNFLIPSFYFGADWWVPCDPWAKRLAPRVERILYSQQGTYRTGWWRRSDAADRSGPAPGAPDEETR